jgi:hypothetical protein
MSMTKDELAEINSSTAGEKLFDLRVLFAELWRWKWILLLAVIIGGVIGIRNASNFVPTYEANMIVMPISQGGTGGSTSAGGGNFLGVVRSLGLGAGRAPNASFDLFKVMIGSTLLAEKIQKKHRLMQRVYRDSWNADDQSWIKPNIDEDSFRQRIRRFFHLNSWHAPDLESLSNYLSGMVKVEPISETDFFKISVEHSDREFALYLLEIAHREADEFIGLRRRQEQEERIKYLERQIETTRLAEVRGALLSLLMQLEQQAIIVSSKPPYTIKVISPLHASALAKEPALLRIIALPIGILLALVLVIVTIVASFRTE